MRSTILPIQMSWEFQFISILNTFPDDTHAPEGVFMTQEIWSNKRALTVVTTHPRLLGKVCPLSRPRSLIFGPENTITNQQRSHKGIWRTEHTCSKTVWMITTTYDLRFRFFSCNILVILYAGWVWEWTEGHDFCCFWVWNEDRDENVFGTNIHTIHSICNFEACFFHLTSEYMDFLMSLLIIIIICSSRCSNK